MAAGWLGSDPIDDRTIHGSRAEWELRTWVAHEGGMPYEQHRAVHPFWKNVESVEQDGDNGWWVRRRDGVDEYVPVENREEFKRMKGRLAGRHPGLHPNMQHLLHIREGEGQRLMLKHD